MPKRKLKIPGRKISETFLHFAEPLLQGLSAEAPERQARPALEVAFTAWNVVVIADVLHDETHLKEARRLTAAKPELAALMEYMLARKRSLFSNDQRLIGNWEVTRTPDGINLHAEARDPYSLPRPLVHPHPPSNQGG